MPVTTKAWSGIRRLAAARATKPSTRAQARTSARPRIIPAGRLVTGTTRAARPMPSPASRSTRTRIRRAHRNLRKRGRSRRRPRRPAASTPAVAPRASAVHRPPTMPGRCRRRTRRARTRTGRRRSADDLNAGTGDRHYPGTVAGVRRHGAPGSLVGTSFRSAVPQPIQNGVHHHHVRAGVRVSAASVAWTVCSSAVSIVIGLASNSLALLTFGLVGVLDAVGSASLIVHFRHALRHDALSERHERIALRIVTAGLIVVGVYGLVEGVHRFVAGHAVDPSPAGIAVAATSGVVLSG